MGKYNNTIVGEAGFGLLGESLSDSGQILGIRKTVRASPSLGVSLVTDEVIDIGKGFLELGTEKSNNKKEQRG